MAQPQIIRGDNSTDTKRKPRRKPKPPTTEVRPLIATFRLNKNNRKLYVHMQVNQDENFALLDTGTTQSALSEKELRRITAAHPSAVVDELPAEDFGIQITNSIVVPVRKQVVNRFFVAGLIFEEQFMVLAIMGNMLIGRSFLKKHSLALDLNNNLVQFPDLSL